jgi:hypothetical protein
MISKGVLSAPRINDPTLLASSRLGLGSQPRPTDAATSFWAGSAKRGQSAGTSSSFGNRSMATCG